MSDDQVVDHRTRVGQARRQKMRMRLIESAFVVFSEKGIDASVIDDVISAAAVSRGTFYNYFRTNSDLVVAIGESLSNEIVSLIEERIGGLEDPVEILATGLRLFLHTAYEFPYFARFIWRAGFNIDAAGHLVHEYVPRHIWRSMERKSFQVEDISTALEIILGIMLAAVYSISTRSPGVAYAERMVAHALLALGVSADEAARLVALPLPEIRLADDSLLVRSNELAQPDH